MEKLQKYIIDYFIRELTMPTVREIGAEFGWRSTNAVWKKLKVLEYCGIIRKHLGKYTLNPKVFYFRLEEMKEHDDSDYWKIKKKYYDRIAKSKDLACTKIVCI